MDSCSNTPLYTAVATFDSLAGKYSNTGTAQSGIFLGCEGTTGFKVVKGMIVVCIINSYTLY